MVIIIVCSVVGVLIVLGVIGFILIKRKNNALKKNLATYETL
jgi:hypothetical protein